jgi:solute:Na+ symporter, SSS family
MTLTLLDWSAIAGYLLITIVLGLYFRRRSGKNMEEYFASGRNVSWWLAGTSMVATTFSADTPLAVTGLVYTQGIAGNWLWWASLLSGMMTVFLFARLWRRSGLLTDVQFAEMRYSGKPAAFLRGFRALYIGLLMNCLILGWVTKAMVSILTVIFPGVDSHTALLICILGIIPFTGFYVALGGLWGVLWTDLFQFILKMGVVIAIAYYAVRACGGMHALLTKLQTATPPDGAAVHGNPVAFFPNFSQGFTASGWWMLPVITFVVNLGIQWWAAWYPGAEPGGGGYIAQRIFSAKNERHGLLSVLWFNIAHYAVRPWPWILTALATIVLFPGLKEPEKGYILALTNYLPPALRGLAVAGFLAAFMSTVATQLNWGASYLVADFYRRFIKKDGSDSHYVNIGRLATVVLVLIAGYVASQLTSIKSGWEFVLEIGAGTGGVYLLRWYWWRINAWSEISAMLSSLFVVAAVHKFQFFAGGGPVEFAKTALITTGITTLVWIVVTLTTKPEPQAVLQRFYRDVRPDVRGWRPIAATAPEVPATRDLGANLVAWIFGCTLVYATLFSTGYLIMGEIIRGIILAIIAILSAFVLRRQLTKSWSAAPPAAKPAMEAVSSRS